MTMTSDPSKMQSMARRRPTGPAPIIRTQISLAAFYSLRACCEYIVKERKRLHVHVKPGNKNQTLGIHVRFEKHTYFQLTIRSL